MRSYKKKLLPILLKILTLALLRPRLAKEETEFTSFSKDIPLFKFAVLQRFIEYKLIRIQPIFLGF